MNKQKSLPHSSQYMISEYVKNVLKNNRAILLDSACETELSDNGRLHDSFINIENMMPEEYKNGGENLYINFHFTKSPFGHIFIASTGKGICHVSFTDDEDTALDYLRGQFLNACYQRTTDSMQQNALSIFTQDRSKPEEIRLHIKGTEFQLNVWKILLRIPVGQLATYGDIARQLNNPKACRAVGSAVGDNPVAFFIPCHRVVRSSGELGGYHWGLTYKRSMILWEASKPHAFQE
ncbi:MAG: methylated-DNA--[protein]-cysteine S-methyltransferase [Tannerellaceae bacterium]|jgi:AraC family transcriptional regulator of adaptative response/methylated-DNA-[protein]-cysteine methyltransferase|nr:methylated-DNA--[protein]-cysteine S-methyltransferase [Tannerellaceae bacterium]